MEMEMEMERTELDSNFISKEIEYAQAQGRKGLDTLITVSGQPFVFVVYERTAWLCDFVSKRAVCVLKNSVKQTVRFLETDKTVAIQFSHSFRNTIAVVPTGDATDFKESLMECFDPDKRQIKSLVFVFERDGEYAFEDEIRWETPSEFIDGIQRLTDEYVSHVSKP